MHQKTFFAALLFSALLAGCLDSESKPTPSPSAVPTFQLPLPTPTPSVAKTGAAAIAENMLLGLNASNYTLFSADFSDRFKTTLTEALFPKVRKQVFDVTGYYLSSSQASFYSAAGLTFYSVPAHFENDEVNATFLFNRTTGKIEGFAFDSELLRASQMSNLNIVNANEIHNSNLTQG